MDFKTEDLIMNNGVSYELFVQRIQQALFDAQQMSGFKTINVVHNCKLIDKNGVERQFDLYWEFELGGLIYRTIIECKDFESTVPISKVDELVGKLKAFPDIRGIIATRNGFQSGGVKEAVANGSTSILRPSFFAAWVRITRASALRRKTGASKSGLCRFFRRRCAGCRIDSGSAAFTVCMK